MAMIPLPKDFKEFLQFLHSHNVEYLLIGGWAVGYYGYPRATGDMDVWVSSSLENARNIVDALKDFGFGTATGASLDVFTRPNDVVRLGNPPLRIDILTGISGVVFAECYARRAMADLDGVAVSIIALPDLKANKAASGRLKDLADLQNLP